MLKIAKLSIAEIYHLAESEDTPTEILTQLGNEKNLGIIKRVASNPNTPLETLRKLSLSVPDLVINNPVCDIICLDNSPQMVFLKVALAKISTTPKFRLLTLAATSNSQVLNALLNRNDLSVDIFKKIIVSGDLHIRARVAGNYKTPVEILEILAKDNDEIIKIAVARNNKTPIEILELLASNDNSLIKGGIARNPNTSSDILKELVRKSYWLISQNKQDKWIYFRDSFLREAIASHKNTPLDTLNILAKDRIRNVAVAVARNSNTPIYTLEKLANNRGKLVRAAVAENSNLPKSIIKKLAADSENCVREIIAQNHNLTIDNSADNKDRQQKNNYQKLADRARDSDYKIRQQVAVNRDTSIDLLESLSTDPNGEVRQKVASNHHTPIHILKKLLLDPNPDVRLDVAKNNNTPINILTTLDHTQKHNFLKYYQYNNNYNYDNFLSFNFAIFGDIPKEIITLIICGFDLSDKTQTELLNYQGKNRQYVRQYVRISLAQNKKSSPSILAELATDNSKMVRKAVAENPNTPVKNLILLAGDIDLSVRKAVTKYPLNNPPVPLALLEHLAQESYWLVRKKVADCVYTPVHILEQLALDECQYVRLGVTNNCNCPPAILQRLNNDSTQKY